MTSFGLAITEEEMKRVLEKHLIGPRLIITFWPEGMFRMQTYSEATGNALSLNQWSIKDLINMHVGTTPLLKEDLVRRLPEIILSPLLNSLFWVWIERHGPSLGGTNKLTREAVQMYRPGY